MGVNLIMSATTSPVVTILGHVCIDHNTVDGVSYTAWGSPAMFMAAYYQKHYNLTPTIISAYGNDFQKYTKKYQFIPNHPTHEKTLLYRNVVTSGQRVQFCHNTTSSPPQEINDDIKKVLKQTDILIVAPDLPNFTPEYVNHLMEYVPSRSFKVLLPQGYMRRVNEEGSVEKRLFDEAKEVTPYFNAIVISDEDCDNAASIAKEWTSYQPTLCVAITHAAQGATLLYDGTSKLIPTKPLAAQELKNPVGAGDMFSAELAMSLYRGNHPVTAVKKAHTTTGHILSTNPIV
jgi:sugar/nucleoside kinase (ribokinase family)